MFKDTASRCKAIDRKFDILFSGYGPDGEPAPASLLRGSAKSIVLNYPENQASKLAVADIISAAKHLRAAETG